MTETSAEYTELAAILPDVLSGPDDTLEQVRATFDAVHGHDPGNDVTLETTECGIWVGDGGRWSDSTPTIFFVHGGGFVTSPAATYTFYGANLVRHCAANVYVAEYRLAPETVHPGPLDDIVAAYRFVLDAGVDPATTVFLGDSCGGGMALAALVRLRDEGAALPAGLVSLSGWFDLEATGESAIAPTCRDPLLNVEWLRRRERDYVGPDGDPAHPLASPLHADLHGLPPMLLQAGGADRCRSDAERVAEFVNTSGGSAALSIYPGMPHGFQGLVGAIPEADAALAEVAGFVHRVAGAS